MQIMINGMVYNSGEIAIAVKFSPEEIKQLVDDAKTKGELVFKTTPKGKKPPLTMNNFITLDKHRAKVIRYSGGKKLKRMQEEDE